MALPQDQPNPVPDWARNLKSAPPGAAAAAVTHPPQASPPPEYGVALAVYVHKAIADALHKAAESIRGAGEAVEPRTAAYNALEGEAIRHANMAAQMGEGLPG